MRRRAVLLFLVLLPACSSGPAGKQMRQALGLGGWTEGDFQHPLVAHEFRLSPDLAQAETVVGESRSYTIANGDTLLDVARWAGLGINELADAYPQLNEWSPTPGTELELPTVWILPKGEPRGLVINVPEMRLFYYPAEGEGAGRVITYPIGIGRDDWRTPVGKFRVVERTENPTWVIPESIRAERIKEKGSSETAIAGGDPTNPLGLYRLRTNLDLYGIHGTNQPWAVGRKTSHGCIRLYPEDIEQIFPLVPVGTPGVFVDQPVKIGARDGVIYVEAHPPMYDASVDYPKVAQKLLRERGWESLVDPTVLAAALEKRSGMPTRISRSVEAARR